MNADAAADIARAVADQVAESLADGSKAVIARRPGVMAS